jgi:hypothetical protein
VPALLTLHNTEEALFVLSPLRTAAARLPALAGILPAPEAMYVALAVATVTLWLMWLISARGGRRGWEHVSCSSCSAWCPLRDAITKRWVTGCALAGLRPSALFVHVPTAAVVLWSLGS